MPAFRPSGEGLIERSVLIDKEQVGFVRYLLEAEDGLGFLHGDGAGALTILSTVSQAVALDRLLADLAAEGLIVHLR